MSQQGVTYDDAVTAAHTAQTVQEERKKGIVDQSYYRGVPGLLKLLEAVFSVLGYILIAVSSVFCTAATDGFFKFVTMGAFVATLVLWVFLLLKIPQRILRCDCVNWIFVEFVFYGVTIIFYFFADLFMSIQGCTALHKVAVAFGWFAFVPFCVDFFFAVRRFLEQRRLTREAAQAASTPQVTVDTKY